MTVSDGHVERAVSAPAAPTARRSALGQAQGPTIDEGLLGRRRCCWVRRT